MTPGAKAPPRRESTGVNPQGLPIRSRYGDQIDGEQSAPGARRGPADAPSVGDPRPSEAHGYQVWLWHGALRSLHGPHRRSANPLLRDPDFGGRGQERDYDRGVIWYGGQGGADGLGQPRRTPVWLLPERPDHVR